MLVALWESGRQRRRRLPPTSKVLGCLPHRDVLASRNYPFAPDALLIVSGRLSRDARVLVAADAAV